MNPFTATRHDLADRLREATHGLEVEVYDHVPQAPTLPAVIIQAADPFAAEGETPNEWAAAFDVWLLVDLLDNETATTELEALLTVTLPALGWEYGVDRVTRPGPAHTADWLAHGITVTTSRYITL